MDPNVDIKEEKRELTLAWAMEAASERGGGCPLPRPKGKEDGCSLEEKAGSVRLLVYSQEGKNILRKITSILLLYLFSVTNIVLNLPGVGFAGSQGISTPEPETVLTLPFAEFWIRKKKRMLLPSMIGAREPIIVEDLL